MEYENLYNRIPQRQAAAENEASIVIELQKMLLDLWDVFFFSQEILVLPQIASGTKRHIVAIQEKIMTHIMNFGYALSSAPLPQLEKEEDLLCTKIDSVIDELSFFLDELEAA